MTKFRRSLVLLAALATAAPLAAQQAPDRDAILAVTKRLFDGMRAGDSAMVRSTFHPKVSLASAFVRQGTPVVSFDGTSDGFVKAVGTPHAEVWDERVANEVVHQDGTLAVVWMDYTFYLGTKLSHCGVDAFILAKEGSDWKIISLADTRRREGCPAL